MFKSGIDLAFFAVYIAFNIFLGLWVSRRNKNKAKDYFLAGDRLPWYAIGGSIIAANISTEHFIGMVGLAYVWGFAVAQWEWGNWFTFSVLIWIFLPYYLRGGIYTMPEFLERRYNKTCRYLYAVVSLVMWITAQMSVVMLAGGKALEGMFGFDQHYTIIALAVLAGSYTIYGGLIAVAWTDFLQFLVMMVGGIVVGLLGLHRIGGIDNLMHLAPEKFKFIYPMNHTAFPWLGLYTASLSGGIWYSCTNQFIVQRCLGARSEWDGRMGVVFAGFMKILLPLLVVIPGLIAAQLYPHLKDPDQSYPTLVRDLIPAGLAGIVMAGLASAVLSHLSSVLNSSSTVYTMDLYKPLFSPNASDEQLVRVGRVSSFVILIFATALALWLTRGMHSVFQLIQNIGMYVAAPVAAVFLLGVLWRRTTSQAATFVLFFGFPYTWFVEHYVLPKIGFLSVDMFGFNRTLIVWLTSMLLLVVISLLTPAPDPDKIRNIIWSWRVARMPESERERNRGVRNLLLWWLIFVGTVACLYAYIFWFQFWGPGAHAN